MNSTVIQNRWPHADAFYAERDHRTRLEIDDLYSYVHRPVEIHVTPEGASDLAVQQIALLAANLTARWARHIRVFVPLVGLSSQLRAHDDASLGARIEREMRAADPFGYWEFPDVGAPSHSQLRLFIGAGHEPWRALTTQDYVVDASGWSAIGFRGGDALKYRREPATAPAAALAAAIGAADLFKRAIGHHRRAWLETINWCTWTHTLTPDWAPSDVPDPPTAIELGDLLLAGVGAIGSALLYIVGLMPARGRIVLLDRDDVDTSNLNRSPLFTAADAAASRAKTEVGRRFLDTIGIRSNVFNGTWREHGERLSQYPFDAWVSLTNEDSAWAAIPFQLPPVVLHGTTTSGWGLAFGRHIPLVEDCTLCRLPRPAAVFRGPCAEGDVRALDEREPLRASLPFLSTVSAALVAAELMKLAHPAVGSLPNCVSADFRFGLPAVVALAFKASSTCRGCQMARLPLWANRGGQGRYATLSSEALRESIERRPVSGPNESEAVFSQDLR